jgi:hypothetical protein
MAKEHDTHGPAGPTSAVEYQEAAQLVGYADSPEYEWVTVHTEAADQVVFDVPGDIYIGIYAGHEIIYPKVDRQEWFLQLHWTDPAGAKYANAGYELRNAYCNITYADDGSPIVTDKIAPGSMTRNELRKLVDIDKPSEMRSFRIDVAAPRRNADNSGS